MIFSLITLTAVLLLLISHQKLYRPGIWFFKILASTGFVAFALERGALGTTYGRWVLAALLAGWLGDLLLLPKSSLCFLLGMGSFFAGHILYSVAFITREINTKTSFFAAAILAVLTYLIYRWLKPALLPKRTNMILPVSVYVIAESIMITLAAGATASSGDPKILIGALLFYFSDYWVARNRFVSPGLTNRIFGLPLYYVAQLIWAATVSR
jgi:uncharacterized membrane protein YhhN